MGEKDKEKEKGNIRERIEREGSYKKQICILGNSHQALILIYNDIFLIFHTKL